MYHYGRQARGVLTNEAGGRRGYVKSLYKLAYRENGQASHWGEPMAEGKRGAPGGRLVYVDEGGGEVTSTAPPTCARSSTTPRMRSARSCTSRRVRDPKQTKTAIHSSSR